MALAATACSKHRQLEEPFRSWSRSTAFGRLTYRPSGGDGSSVSKPLWKLPWSDRSAARRLPCKSVGQGSCARDHNDVVGYSRAALVSWSWQIIVYKQPTIHDDRMVVLSMS